MRDALFAPTLGMVCRYTDPDGNRYDAIVREIEGAMAYIEYRPGVTGLISEYRWVNCFTLSVPR